MKSENFKDVEKDEGWLWRVRDEKNNLLFTQIPNRLLKNMVKGEYTLNELRILLYLCRLTFGFRWKERTGLLSNKDFEKITGIISNHAKEAIDSLLLKKVIFRDTKRLNSYIYLINRSLFGIETEFKEKKGKLLPYNSGNGRVNELLRYFIKAVRKKNTAETIEKYMRRFLRLLQNKPVGIDPCSFEFNYIEACVLMRDEKGKYLYDDSGSIVENEENKRIFNKAEKNMNFSKRIEEITGIKC